MESVCWLVILWMLPRRRGKRAATVKSHITFVSKYTKVDPNCPHTKHVRKLLPEYRSERKFRPARNHTSKTGTSELQVAGTHQMMTYHQLWVGRLEHPHHLQRERIIHKMVLRAFSWICTEFSIQSSTGQNVYSNGWLHGIDEPQFNVEAHHTTHRTHEKQFEPSQTVISTYHTPTTLQCMRLHIVCACLDAFMNVAYRLYVVFACPPSAEYNQAQGQSSFWLPAYQQGLRQTGLNSASIICWNCDPSA